jgi:hypothetical protein
MSVDNGGIAESSERNKISSTGVLAGGTLAASEASGNKGEGGWAMMEPDGGEGAVKNAIVQKQTWVA